MNYLAQHGNFDSHIAIVSKANKNFQKFQNKNDIFGHMK